MQTLNNNVNLLRLFFNKMANEQRVFGFYCRPDSAKAETAAEKACKFFEARGIRTVNLANLWNVDDDPATNSYWRIPNGTKSLPQLEAALALGGDGSFLHIARLMAPYKVPVLGINFGHVGYLCAVSSDNLEQTLELIINRRYHVEERTMIDCQVFKGTQAAWHIQALNEILVGGCNRTVSLEVSVDGANFGTIRGDGLILATKTGSTAYSFSAGGPILLLDNAFCLVASNAVFASSIRSLVLPSSSTVRICNLTHPARPYVVADGQQDCTLQKGDIVELKESPLKARFIEFKDDPPIQNLRRSFKEKMAAAL